MKLLNPTKLLKISSIKAETNHLMRKTNVNIEDSSLWVNDENEKWISQKTGWGCEKSNDLVPKKKQNKNKSDDDDANLPTDLALDTNMPGGSTVKSVFKSCAKGFYVTKKRLFAPNTSITARTLRNSPRNPDNFIVDETNYKRHVKLTFFLFRVSGTLIMMTHFGSPRQIENQERWIERKPCSYTNDDGASCSPTDGTT